jgi:hypothetical protein
VGLVLRVELEGQIGLIEMLDPVPVGVGGGELVLAGVHHVQAGGLRVGRAHDGDQGLVGGGDVAGVGGLGQVGEEDVAPHRSAGGGADILHIEDLVLEVFVEDAGLDFNGSLRGFESVLELKQVAGAVGGEVKGVDQAEGKCGEGEDGDNTDKGECADAAGAHGGDLGVCGEAAETEQDAGEDGSRNGDGEAVGQHVAEDAQGIRERG